MVSNYIYAEKSLRIAIEIYVLGVLLLSGIASAAVVDSVEIRGEVAEGPFLWDANNFPVFFYDLQSDIKTETLNISYINGSTIPQGQIIYSTSSEEVSFTYPNFGKYQVVGFMAEKYFARYTINSTPPNPRPTNDFSNLSALSYGQLHRVLIDDDTKRTISVNGTIALQEGYVLKGIDIDLNARTMLLSLLKDGTEVDVSPLSAGETYVYSKNISGVENLPLIMVRFENVFSGQELQVAFLKGLFQISDNPTILKTGNKFGEMIITSVTKDAITMRNSMDINLNKNTNALLMGNITLKVADSDSLTYYPFVEYTTPGTYEIRGMVADIITNPDRPVSWDAKSFAGFYYDLNYDRSTESLTLVPTLRNVTRTIAKEQLWYNTTRVGVDFKVVEKEGVGISIAGKTQYQLVGWQAEKWIAINDKANQIAKLAYEMGKEDKKTLTTGETWMLGAGYELTINAINARTTPRKVWFTLKKDGVVIVEGIGQAPNGGLKQPAVYYKTKTILGEQDALLFTVYIDNIFSGAISDMVQFKYAWLIDENSAKEIKTADRFGIFEVRTADWNHISLSNENIVNLSKNNETNLMGDIKFKVADSDTLRFYPKVDYVIHGTSAGTVIRSKYPLSVSPNGILTITLTPSQNDLFTSPGYRIIETIPTGFIYLNTTAGASIEGNVITLTQLGSSPITYRLMAPSDNGSYKISGTFKDKLDMAGIVTGTTSIWVGAGYDINGDGRIGRNEAIQAVIDYFEGNITRQDAIDVVVVYFTGG